MLNCLKFPRFGKTQRSVRRFIRYPLSVFPRFCFDTVTDRMVHPSGAGGGEAVAILFFFRDIFRFARKFP